MFLPETDCRSNHEAKVSRQLTTAPFPVQALSRSVFSAGLATSRIEAEVGATAADADPSGRPLRGPLTTWAQPQWNCDDDTYASRVSVYCTGVRHRRTTGL